MEARDIGRYDTQYEYDYDGNLALERAERRSWQREQVYSPEERTRPRSAPRTAARPRVAPGQAVLLALLVLAMMFAVVYTQTLVQQNNLTMNSLKKELAALEKDNAALELDLILAEDLGYVRQAATQRLGMSAVGEYQVVEITLD